MDWSIKMKFYKILVDVTPFVAGTIQNEYDLDLMCMIKNIDYYQFADEMK